MGVFYQLDDSGENCFCELRERAEAGTVLRCVDNTEAKCGIAVKRERTRHEPRLPFIKNEIWGAIFLPIYLLSLF